MTQMLGSVPDCPEWSLEVDAGRSPPRVTILSDRRNNPMAAPMLGRAAFLEPVAWVWRAGDEVIVSIERLSFRPRELETLPQAVAIAVQVLRDRWL